MKKLLLPGLLLLTIYACNKSSGNKPNTPLSGLSGTYMQYKETDTTFKGGDRRNGAESVDVKTFTGDTLYQNLGTKNYAVIPRAPGNDLGDTLVFTSPTTGTEHQFNGYSGTFTYSLQTNVMNRPQEENFYFSRIFTIDDTHIRIDVSEGNEAHDTVDYRWGRYYHKVH